jgi:hypothetical protein
LIIELKKKMAAATFRPPMDKGRTFIPREHGATAMLLTPFFCAAILLKQVSWQEIVALLAIVSAFAVKDPLVVIARQYLVWKQRHEETKRAVRSAALELVLLAGCGVILLVTRSWRPWLLLFLGAGGFTVLAVTANVRNRQRSEWFQVASAVALTSTSIAACLSVRANVPGWCWLLWFLCALQATAGIFVVYARLDARVAARKQTAETSRNRHAAFVCEIILIAAAAFFAYSGHPWITTALLILAAGYVWELRRQDNPASLQMPLTRVGQQALALSIAYSLMLVIGLQ